MGNSFPATLVVRNGLPLYEHLTFLKKSTNLKGPISFIDILSLFYVFQT